MYKNKNNETAVSNDAMINETESHYDYNLFVDNHKKVWEGL